MPDKGHDSIQSVFATFGALAVAGVAFVPLHALSPGVAADGSGGCDALQYSRADDEIDAIAEKRPLWALDDSVSSKIPLKDKADVFSVSTQESLTQTAFNVTLKGQELSREEVKGYTDGIRDGTLQVCLQTEGIDQGLTRLAVGENSLKEFVKDADIPLSSRLKGHLKNSQGFRAVFNRHKSNTISLFRPGGFSISRRGQNPQDERFKELRLGSALNQKVHNFVASVVDWKGVIIGPGETPPAGSDVWEIRMSQPSFFQEMAKAIGDKDMYRRIATVARLDRTTKEVLFDVSFPNPSAEL